MTRVTAQAKREGSVKYGEGDVLRVEAMQVMVECESAPDEAGERKIQGNSAQSVHQERN